ncbi:MAG: PaaI family thioesterase [Halanaeroarchaeum sp.]
MADVFDSEDARAFLQSYLDQHGFLSFLDLTVESLEPGAMVMRVPYDEKLANQGRGNGNVHGGIAATLIDTAGGLSVHSTLDDPINAGVATIDLNVSYLRPARGDLIASAEVVRVGSSVGVANVDVESTTPDGERATVAVGRGSFRVFRADDEEP